MKILSSNDTLNPEIEVSGQATEFISLGEKLLKGDLPLYVDSIGIADRFYPQCLRALIFSISQESAYPSMIQIDVKDYVLVITGNTQAFQKLGQSLINVFTNAKEGEHMHLDYYEENQLVAPTRCDVVFTFLETK